jgi:hypothetical protein
MGYPINPKNGYFNPDLKIKYFFKYEMKFGTQVGASFSLRV